VKSESTGDGGGGGGLRLRRTLRQPAPPSAVVDCLGIDNQSQPVKRQRGRRPSHLHEHEQSPTVSDLRALEGF
jgi:hypothetical protein